MEKMSGRCEELERQIEQDRRLGRAASQRLREEVGLMLERSQRGQLLDSPPPLKQGPVSASEPVSVHKPATKKPAAAAPKPAARTGSPAPRVGSPALVVRAGSPAVRAGSPRKVYQRDDLEGMNPMKLKAAAKAAGLPPVPMGKPARTKDETIAAVLELASADAAGRAQ